MKINISTYKASDLFLIQHGLPLNGMPMFTNLRFKTSPNLIGTFNGLGLYGILFDDHLIYIGKFLGQKKNPYGGDIRQARWSKHIGSLTLRARNLSFSKRAISDIATLGSCTPQADFQNVDVNLLSRDRGCNSTMNRFVFGAANWQDFANLSDSIMRRFKFVYASIVCQTQSTNILRKMVGQVEDTL
jgi:hypothetical protein